VRGKEHTFFFREAVRWQSDPRAMADDYMQKAIGFVQEAIKADQENKLDEAFAAYMKGERERGRGCDAAERLFSF
jgi:hypothetical protein